MTKPYLVAAWVTLPCALFVHVLTWRYFLELLGYSASDGVRFFALMLGALTTGIVAALLGAYLENSK